MDEDTIYVISTVWTTNMTTQVNLLNDCVCDVSLTSLYHQFNAVGSKQMANKTYNAVRYSVVYNNSSHIQCKQNALLSFFMGQLGGGGVGGSSVKL